MDYHALQQKLFSIDPTDPKEDLAKLQAQARGGATGDVPPTKNYVTESVDVPSDSLPLDIDSMSDFAALAGVTLSEKQKHGDYAKGSDNMPTAEPGRTEHPLKDKLVGEEDDPFISAIDGSFGQSSIADKIGYSPTGELYKAIYKAIKAVMPTADDATIKKAADAAANTVEENTNESGEEEKGAIKDRYLKKESTIANELYKALTEKGL